MDYAFLQSELKEKVHATLSGIPFHGGITLYIKSVFIACLLTLSYICYLATPQINNIFCYGIIIFLLAASLIMIGFNILHDASHNCFFSSYRANKWMAFLAGCIMGLSASVWHEKHVKSHHAYTNIIEKDPDINTEIFIRSNEYHCWYFWNRWQAYYAFILYAIVLFASIYYYDYYFFFNMVLNKNKIRKNKKLLAETALFVTCKTIHIILFLLIPAYYFHSIFNALGSYMLIIFLQGAMSVILFQLGHIYSSSVFYPISNTSVSNRLLHQLSTTANFVIKNPIIRASIGGINMQIVHHLFPYISHVHYRKIHPIISYICQKNNLPYNEYSTFKEALIGHFSYLNKMSFPNKK